MLIRKIRLENILSFGPEGMELELRPLNVLVGPNGCGKSNLFDVLRLLSAIPKDFDQALRKREQALDLWAWRGGRGGVCGISVLFESVIAVEPGSGFQPVPEDLTARYEMEFVPVPVLGFRIAREKLLQGSHRSPLNGVVQRDLNDYRLLPPTGDGKITKPVPNPERSILNALSGAEGLQALIEAVSHRLQSIAIYSDWEFGRTAKLRGPNETWRESVHVLPDYTNLWLALHTIVSRPESRKRLEAQIPRLYDDAKHYISKLIPGTSWVQGNIEEASDNQFPPFVLSDGTIRYLMLCALLLSDTPPALIALDEPELGLHPDLINGIAEMIKDASTRTQIIITTHSPILLDAFSDDPESVVACDKFDGQTHMQRLTTKRYKALGGGELGDLWMRGKLGGTRW